MKIIVLYLGRHGAGPMYSLEYCKALLMKGNELLVIISLYCDNLNKWKELEIKYESKLKLVIIPTYNSKYEFVIESLNVFRFYNLIKLINEFGSKYILTPMVHPWHNIILSFISKHIIKIKIIHDSSVHIGERNLFSIFLNWIDIKISDKLVVLSEYSKKELESKTRKSITVIPHAEFGCYNHLGEECFEYKINYKIGFFGRINKYKGLNNLLEAFGIVCKQMPNLKLLIAGNGDCTEYEKFFHKYNSFLELHIKWIEDNEIVNLLKDVDIVVLPYIEATQSGVIPLAFALGKTVIATNVGGLPEQVPDGVGIVIPVNSPDILAKTIIELYESPSKIVVMGKKAKKYVNENLTWETSANKLLDYLSL